MRILFHTVFALLAIYLMTIMACVHDPVFVDDDMGPPIDTMEVDTMPVDTMMVDTMEPCDPDVVYFEDQVLPILKANCAQSGCHDAGTAEEGIILDSYENVIASDVVEAFDLDGSDLFERITDSDPDKRMPPPPANSLAASQINTIATWILQGALDEMCDDTTGTGCETNNVSFAQHIDPVILTNCRTCHSGAFPAGGYDFTTYSGVLEAVNNNRLLGAIKREVGFSPMPQGGDKLDDCTISQFEAWVADGAPDN